MKWIRQHKIFSVTAGIVIALCLFVLGSYLAGGGSGVLGRGVQSVVSAIEKPLSAFTGGAGDTFRGVFRFSSVLEENEKLKEENAMLRQENIDLSMKRDELDRLGELSKAFDFEPYSGQGKAVAARIISLNNSNTYDVFTIDAGSSKGIEKNDIVVDGEGLIGKVKETGGNWAKVVSVLNENNSISFKVQRKTSITGIVAGDGKGKITGYLMDNKATIVKGDVLVTSGMGIYPEGIRIGKVTSVDYNDDMQLKEITVKSTVKFTSLQKVAVFK